MATHSSILAWEIPWLEETGGLQSMQLQRVRHDSVTTQSIYSVVLISAIQQSNSVIHTYILFHILFHYGLSWDIEYSFPVLYSRTLSFIYPIHNSFNLLIPNPNRSLPHPLLLDSHKSVGFSLRRCLSHCLRWGCCSVAKSCPILCKPMDCNTPGLPFPHSLSEFAKHIL